MIHFNINKKIHFDAGDVIVTTENIFICDNCETKKKGMMSVGDGQLCLDCYQQYSQAQSALSNAQSSKLQYLTQNLKLQTLPEKLHFCWNFNS